MSFVVAEDEVDDGAGVIGKGSPGKGSPGNDSHRNKRPHVLPRDITDKAFAGACAGCCRRTHAPTSRIGTSIRR